MEEWGVDRGGGGVNQKDHLEKDLLLHPSI